jgi:hypothetical protein
MMEQADIRVLKTRDFGRRGSSPLLRTNEGIRNTHVPAKFFS